MKVLVESFRDRERPLVVMGDFNDEPFNRSITDHALAGNSGPKVLNAQSPRLFNLMWPFLGLGIGTHYFDNSANVLDQFWVSRGILNGRGGFQLDKESTTIEMFDTMVSRGTIRHRFGSAGLLKS